MVLSLRDYDVFSPGSRPSSDLGQLWKVVGRNGNGLSPERSHTGEMGH